VESEDESFNGLPAWLTWQQSTGQISEYLPEAAANPQTGGIIAKGVVKAC
jgi:hypothetical protein